MVGKKSTLSSNSPDLIHNSGQSFSKGSEHEEKRERLGLYREREYDRETVRDLNNRGGKRCWRRETKRRTRDRNRWREDYNGERE